MMKICRFVIGLSHARIGIISDDQTVLNLEPAGVTQIMPLLESPEPASLLAEIATQNLPRHGMSEVKLLPPIEQQEVWAAGVTYLRSKTARMEESEFSANAYDRVYEAERPELFFKSLPEKVVGPGEPAGIRKDARWSVPEPELALVINSSGLVAGYTIGNDMSSRDIEGENLLYLPQAKVYNRSCALGPCIVIGASESTVRTWTIHIEINRKGELVFKGDTSASQIRRSFAELTGFLFRSQSFPRGAILLTGTGVVPPETFTLQEGDLVSITISGIGTLTNSIVSV
jgi:2-dehydro-3-deoxy-D-arabinonate dehydratase